MEDEDDILRWRYLNENDNNENYHSGRSNFSLIDKDSEQGSERWEEKKLTDEAQITPRI